MARQWMGGAGREKRTMTSSKKKGVDGSDMRNKGLLLVGFAGAFIAFVIFIIDSMHHGEVTIAPEFENLSHARWPVACALPAASRGNPLCQTNACARIVWDNLVAPEDAEALRQTASSIMNKYGGADGGPTILDLHSGALSRGTKFVDVYKMLNEDDQASLATVLDTYNTVQETIREAVEEAFQIEGLTLTKPTFFSRMTNKPARTMHDEYWHTHIDKVTYGSFDYTCLLYLSDYRANFTGGRFIFTDKSYRGGDVHRVVEPRTARVSCFTSGAENPHSVEKMQSGTRFALTIAFTCNKEQGIPPPSTGKATTSSAVPSNL